MGAERPGAGVRDSAGRVVLPSEIHIEHDRSVLDYRRVFVSDRRSPFAEPAPGDSIRGTAETDFGAVGLGMTMGVILGLIPLPLPGGALLRLGLAGGPLIAGLVLGRLHRTGPITWSIPMSANLTLRQIGLVLFQAGVGTRAGYGFLQTVRGSGIQMIAAGAVITAGVALGMHGGEDRAGAIVGDLEVSRLACPFRIFHRPLGEHPGRPG